MASIAVVVLVFSLAIMCSLPGSTDAQRLQVGFHKATCPQMEAIVRWKMQRVISAAPSLAGPLLRMHFHDCFVRGCDASILLSSTKNNKAEKDSPANLSLRGFNVIEDIKAMLEKACPGIVSCADILALSQGPSWEVQTGRRDGKISMLGDTINLPPPTADIALLKAMFFKKGLSMKDLVVLSGAHTIGISMCSSFSNRLYNFTGKHDADPTLDSEYMTQLKTKCKPNDAKAFVEMDPGSFTRFDTSYYQLVAKRRGILVSDVALLDDGETRAYVKSQAKAGYPYGFFEDFGVSMVKMGSIGVLTGNQGEIRKQCAFVN